MRLDSCHTAALLRRQLLFSIWKSFVVGGLHWLFNALDELALSGHLIDLRILRTLLVRFYHLPSDVLVLENFDLGRCLLVTIGWSVISEAAQWWKVLVLVGLVGLVFSFCHQCSEVCVHRELRLVFSIEFDHKSSPDGKRLLSLGNHLLESY